MQLSNQNLTMAFNVLSDQSGHISKEKLYRVFSNMKQVSSDVVLVNQEQKQAWEEFLESFDQNQDG